MRASFVKGQNFRKVGLHQCPSERKGDGVPVPRLIKARQEGFQAAMEMLDTAISVGEAASDPRSLVDDACVRTYLS
jgi:hypothetical protein